MKTNHTPGPWVLIDSRETIWGDIVIKDTESGYDVCEINDYEPNQATKNARLIAAAPDLLKFAKAIQGIMFITGHNLNSTATRKDRSAFISKIIGAWNQLGIEAIRKATEDWSDLETYTGQKR